MYQLLTYGCDNPYGDGEDKLLLSRTHNDYEHLKGYIEQYKAALKEKQIVRLHAFILEVNTESGDVKVLENVVAQVPPKKRTVINAAAAPKVKVSAAKKFLFQPPPPPGMFEAMVSSEDQQ